MYEYLKAGRHCVEVMFDHHYINSLEGVKAWCESDQRVLRMLEEVIRAGKAPSRAWQLDAEELIRRFGP